MRPFSQKDYKDAFKMEGRIWGFLVWMLIVRYNNSVDLHATAQGGNTS